MSWDILVQAAKSPPPPVDEMPPEWHGETLGTVAEVRDKINATLPEVDWSNPEWGRYFGNGFSYEFNIGGIDPIDNFMVHVRGGGDPVTPLVQMASLWDWYLMDSGRNEWLHHCADMAIGWNDFQKYRNRVLEKLRQENELSSESGE